MEDTRLLDEGIAQVVDEASLTELGSVPIEDVYTQMDHVMAVRPSPMDLYNRWEKQQWAVADLDFSVDAQQWTDMFPPLRGYLHSSLAAFFVGEQLVTDQLPPLVGAAPSEGDRIFLSTQIVDEARHAVFFNRFFSEVIGTDGDIAKAVGSIKALTVSGFKTLFDEKLSGYTNAVRLDPTDYAAWVRGITCYHMMVEGMLALTGQKYLLHTLGKASLLPGFRAGFTAVTRDESRHVNYGVGALRDAVAAGLGSVIEETVLDCLESSCRTVIPPDRTLSITSPEIMPAHLRLSPREVCEFSIHSVSKRLRVSGVREEFLTKLRDEAWQHYEVSFTEYERIQGEEHPVRWYDRQSLSA